MIVIEADRYLVLTVAQMSQIRHTPLQCGLSGWVLARLKAGWIWPVGVVDAVDDDVGVSLAVDETDDRPQVVCQLAMTCS